jgi:hypothetical protein
MHDMKSGDMILIGGTTYAIIQTVRTPGQIRESLPMLSPHFLPVNALRIAVITIATEHGNTQTTVIIETPAGWESKDGEALAITRMEGHIL